MTKGKFITIEGCEGSGKSTQAALLKEYFASSGIPAVFTREPGGTEVSEKIREIILSTALRPTPVAELFLYNAARRQHTEEFILPKIREGYIVVCDRFSDSTLAYQGYGRGLNGKMILSFNRVALAGLVVDLTLFLDAPPEEGFLRKGGADLSDRMDSESPEFHRRVYNGFKQIARNSPGRIVPVNALQSKEAIHQNIVNILKQKNIIP